MPRNLVARQLLRLFRLVEDPAPQLGGDLDSNGFDISMNDGLIEFFNANGNRGGEIDALDGATTERIFIRAGDATGFSDGDPSIQLSGASDASTAGDIVLLNGAGAVVLRWDQSAGRSLINVDTRVTGAAFEADGTVRFTFGTEANGDIFYGSAGDGTLARLPIGAVGRVLRVNSAGTAPEWAAATTADALNEVANGFTNSTYADLDALTTASFSRGVSVTVNTGTSALVTFASSNIRVASGSGVALLGCRVTGASTIAASDDLAVSNQDATRISSSYQWLATGLTPGANTFELQARSSATSSLLRGPSLSVIPL